MYVVCIWRPQDNLQEWIENQIWFCRQNSGLTSAFTWWALLMAPERDFKRKKNSVSGLQSISEKLDKREAMRVTISKENKNLQGKRRRPAVPPVLTPAPAFWVSCTTEHVALGPSMPQRDESCFRMSAGPVFWCGGSLPTAGICPLKLFQNKSPGSWLNAEKLQSTSRMLWKRMRTRDPPTCKK